ncbi:hypothetical protein HYT52_03940 [Candidatus Woesearchaeota archaeon]|nr:hypothetical protein [Candidatus Woesearchaeota archaeon]
MVFKGLYEGLQGIDGRVLQWHRKYAERWEARGHGRYGLPLFVTFFNSSSAFGLEICDDIINWLGFLLTTKEPDEDPFFQQRRDNRSLPSLLEEGVVATGVIMTTPARYLIKALAEIEGCKTPVTDQRVEHDPITHNFYLSAMLSVNRHLRLPLLIAGFGFLAKGIYDAGYSFMTNDPEGYISAQFHMETALPFLQTASSMYWKDGDDPRVSTKYRTLSELAEEVIDKVKGKLTVKLPQPIPIETRSLDDYLTY